jgi:hypothetical protein
MPVIDECLSLRLLERKMFEAGSNRNLMRFPDRSSEGDAVHGESDKRGD